MSLDRSILGMTRRPISGERWGQRPNAPHWPLKPAGRLDMGRNQMGTLIDAAGQIDVLIYRSICASDIVDSALQS